MSTAKEDDDVGGEFYFESDELALKGNADYLGLLRTVAVLEAQRVKAIKDIDRLVECEKEALANPIRFVERLQDGGGTALDLPEQQQIASLPIIDWDKFTKSFGSLAADVAGSMYFGPLGHRHMTRCQIKKRRGSASGAAEKSESDQAGLAVDTGFETDMASACDSDSAANQLVVRGRLCNFGKPQTFNQLWTVEEQKRLQDLLVKFPPEEVEARRWEKVATALGNRTPQQVASRVQKYFIKLSMAGLPVPGRIPNLSPYTRKPFSQNSNYSKQHRHNRFLFGSSTFLATHEPPVFMSDMDDDASGCSSMNDVIDELDDEDDDIPVELRHTNEFRELLCLRRMMRRKIRDEDGAGQHSGYRCDRCNCEPIVGTRWHCVTCPSDSAVDLCEICIQSHYENGVHDSRHSMVPREPSAPGVRSSHVDGDYIHFLQGDYNYLDPNYMPAT